MYLMSTQSVSHVIYVLLFLSGDVTSVTCVNLTLCTLKLKLEAIYFMHLQKVKTLMSLHICEG